MNTKRSKFKLSEEPGFRHRIVEVIITMLASSIVAAVTVSWRVSGAWNSMENGQTKLFENQLKMEGRLEAVEKQANSNVDVNASQSTAIAVITAQGVDVVRRLTSIEYKIDQQNDHQEARRRP